ncbi:MAG: tetratricopeptide repeat protein [Thermodesulfovibrionales bacterium]
MCRSENRLLEKIFMEADDLSQRGETDKAVEKLISGLSVEPDNVDIYSIMTEMLIETKCFHEALKAINTVPPAAKNNIKHLIMKAYCMAGLEKYSEANEAVEEALQKEPDNAAALNLKGILAYNNGDRETAESFFKKAIEADEGYGEPYTNLGVLRWAAEQYTEGLELLECGFVRSPLAADIVTTYYTATTASGTFSQAEKVFQEARTVYPHNRRINFLLIDVLLQQKKYGVAMDEAEQAMILFGIDDDILSAVLDIRKRIGPREIDKKTTLKSTVSLCMIVKNEEQHLAKCLMSAKGVVDEMIVVDTGSGDRTRDIATAFGAKLYDFPWTDDFSEARNASISRASGDWILVLDADEVISPRDHSDLMRLTANTGRPVSYSFVTRNYIPQIHKTGWSANDGTYMEEAGAGWFGSTKVRLFPRDARVRFSNPVHELVEPSLAKTEISVMECAIPVHHYGKLDQEKVDVKWEEYYFLGRKKLDGTGENADALRELAIQAGELTRFDEAIELWQRAIRLQPGMVIAYLNLASVYLQKDDFKPALAAAEEALKLSPDGKEAICNYALCELYAGSAERAMDVLGGLLQKDPAYPSANILLAIACFCSDRKGEGKGVFNSLGISGPALAECVMPFAKKMMRAARTEYAGILIDAAIEAGSSHDDILKLRSECSKHSIYTLNDAGTCAGN